MMRSMLARIFAIGAIAAVLATPGAWRALAEEKGDADASDRDVDAEAPHHADPLLYFYPPFSNDFLLHEFDPDRIARNATTDVSPVAGMRGIAVIIYWSQLCPAENACNFSMIDRILDFWRERGKKVILSVSVIGPPIERVTAAGKVFDSATPEWVLRKVRTFQSPSSNFIGFFPDWRAMANNPQFTFPFPRYDDAGFTAEIRKLVHALGERYDGDPALAFVRIGAGKAGEDNPIGRTNGFGPGTGMPGFTNRIWLDYTRQVTEAYREGFRVTRLEFNMDWLAIVALNAKNVTPITPAEATAAEAFLDELVRDDVFIAFDGGPAVLQSAPGATAANPEGTICSGVDPQPGPLMPATLAAPYAMVLRFESMGVPIGFEIAALSDPCDTSDAMTAMLRRYHPERVIFFGDWAAALDILHHGETPRDAWEVEALTNVFVPFTTIADLPAHEAEAAPQIRRFASELADVVESFLESGKDRDGERGGDER